jgi:hypothetical protein
MRETIWEQMVKRKNEFIGKILVDTEMRISETSIIDLEYKSNADSFFFRIIGKDFNCGFDITAGGIGQNIENAIITFYPFYSAPFYIKEL